MNVIKVDLLEPLNYSVIDNQSFVLQQLSSRISEHFGSGRNFNIAAESVLVFSYCIIIALGILTNSVIIFIIHANNKLKTPHNFLIVNLNLSDIILCAVCSPSTLCQVITSNWFQGLFLCKFVPFIQAATSFVSTGTISIITLQRLEILKLGDIKNKKQISMKNDVLVKTTIIWFLALLLSIPTFVYRTVVNVEMSGIHLFDSS
ncbi:Neuropeptide Y receptor type 1-like protein [Leptotrombidium deliense]|uniref:Neuropeptide Y receptor type 1-like protein n=1 Tax=Leptotrombidium deliense TaxID=299467 RepID=A0A443SIK6_9ACAR|nr:Neuropeptide Y receptor type 1-like protein [Leptotrombidium deliense]